MWYHLSIEIAFNFYIFKKWSQGIFIQNLNILLNIYLYGQIRNTQRVEFGIKKTIQGRFRWDSLST